MPRLDRGIFFLAAEEDPRIKSGGDERGRMPQLARCIFFLATEEDPRIKSGGDEHC
jgi:hypothetical protein